MQNFVGAEHYNPPSILALENRARTGNSTVARPPSPDFQFVTPLERQRPQAASTPLPRPREQPPGQLPGPQPDQLPEPTERSGKMLN